MRRLPTTCAAVLITARLFAQSAPAPMINGEQPAVSPDGRTIAFVTERTGAPRVYLIDVDGGNARALVATEGPQQGPSWTADGRVLFSTFTNGSTTVSSVKPDGSELRALVTVPGRMPAISPDGGRVVYMAGEFMASRMTLMPISGGSATLLNDGKSVAWNYRWSPDGRRIAFTGRLSGGQLAVFVINADGSGLTQLTHLSAADGGAQVPDWSPDGTRLAFQASRKGVAELWVINADGSGERKVVPHAESFHDENARWFPDGKRLAFQSDRSGLMQVWVVNVDGTGLRQLTK